jgi:hypothetical protein
MSDLNVSDKLFDHAPGPSPWYLVPNTSWYTGTYSPTVDGYCWQSAELNHPAAGGKTLLFGADGPVAVLNRYNYVMALNESMLLIWNQARRTTDVSPTLPVRLFVIEPGQLRPLHNDLNSIYERMNTQSEFLAVGGNASQEICLSTTNVNEDLNAQFPPQFQSIDELLILCHSSGIPSNRGLVDLALLVAHPRLSHYRLYPQDWFNDSEMDFGYQWVTRIARNPETGFVHGEGFRIAPFILDDSLRELRRV